MFGIFNRDNNDEKKEEVESTAHPAAQQPIDKDEVCPLTHLHRTHYFYFLVL
jgi:hypothetical protein